jgi:hypothetical protein
MPNKSMSEAGKAMDDLVEKLDRAIIGARAVRDANNSMGALLKRIQRVPHLRGVVKMAETLFTGITDIHSEDGLSRIAKRYVENKAEIEKMRPKSQ